MQGTDTTLIPIDPKIKRTTYTLHKEKREALQATKEVKEEVEMAAPPLQTLRDYCKMTDSSQICLGFQPANPVTFDIKNYILIDLKENSFDMQEIIHPWENLT